MGRWSSRDTVEDCKSISIFWLNKQGYFKRDLSYASGGLRWTNNLGDHKGSIGFSIDIYGNTGKIKFQYTRTDPYSDEKEEMDYYMGLTSTDVIMAEKDGGLCAI